ncbi:MAG TPA: CehA/McbA family metallohydrolase [Thermoplasmata archaeon]|nr:CehA/McbA family metallohydrolase [Thermoplasmata archaeon]
MTGVLRLDLHLHSTYSPDSRLRLAEAVERLAPTGLNGFALTDHNTVAGHSSLRALAEQYPQYRFLPGMEVSTHEGHLLAFGIAEVPPLRRPVAETVEWVEAHGGVAVPAHPARHAHGIGRRVASELRVPALETHNGHNLAVANARAARIAAERSLGATGGSDAHDAGGVGRGFTEFPAGVDRLEDLLDAIRRKATRSGGVSLGYGEMARLAVRTVARRARRGFRAI